MTKLTIAIPTYNRFEYLKECLNSIYNQTFQDFEIFIFDNGSKEEISKEVKKICKNKANYVKNQTNIGSVGIIKHILEYDFKSNYLMIFHDDDTIHPKYLENAIHALNKDSEIAFVCSNFNFCNGKNISIFKNTKNIKYSIFNHIDFLRKTINYLNYSFSSVIYRKSALNSFKLQKFEFDRFSIIYDKPLLIELSKKGKVAYFHNKFINYRLHEQQDSKTGPTEINNFLELLLYYKQNLPQPLNKKDSKLFYTLSSNAILNLGINSSNTFKEFFNFLKEHKDLFFYKYINKFGILGFSSFLLKLIKKQLN